MTWGVDGGEFLFNAREKFDQGEFVRVRGCSVGFPLKRGRLMMNVIAKKILCLHACLELIPGIIYFLFKCWWLGLGGNKR